MASHPIARCRTLSNLRSGLILLHSPVLRCSTYKFSIRITTVSCGAVSCCLVYAISMMHDDASQTKHAVLAISAGRVRAATQHDHAVVLRATRNAYGLLVVCVLAVFSSMFFGASAFMMAHAALLAFVLAEIVRFASQLFYYRQAASMV